MILRLILLGGMVVLFFFVIRIIFNFFSQKKYPKKNMNLKESQTVLVKCSQCGARVPKENAEEKGEQIFCCKDHSDDQD